MPKDDSKVKDFLLEPDAAGAEDKDEANKDAKKAFAKLYSSESTADLPSTLMAARRRHAWLIIISTLALLLLVALTVLFFFSNGSRKFGEEAINLTLTGPSQAPSGQVAEYTIAY